MTSSTSCFTHIEAVFAFDAVGRGVTGDAVGREGAAGEAFATVEITALRAGDTGASGVAGRIYRAREFVRAKFVANKAGEALCGRG